MFAQILNFLLLKALVISIMCYTVPMQRTDDNSNIKDVKKN